MDLEICTIFNYTFFTCIYIQCKILIYEIDEWIRTICYFRYNYSANEKNMIINEDFVALLCDAKTYDDIITSRQKVSKK